MKRKFKQIVNNPELINREKRPGILIRFLRKTNHQSGKNFLELPKELGPHWEALGYFDRIKFSYCSTISQFYLITDSISASSRGYEIQYLSLSGLLSGSKIVDNYDKVYSDLLYPLDKYPYMVISGIKLFKSMRDIDGVVDKIHSIVDEYNIKQKFLYCEVFSSLGYNDFSIIFRTSNFLHVHKLIFEISREILSKYNSGFIYSVPAYLSCESNEKLSIDNSLEIIPYISSKNFLVTKNDLNRNGFNPLVLFGPYDFIVNLPEELKNDFRSLKSSMDFESNEYVNFLIGHYLDNIEGNSDDQKK